MILSFGGYRVSRYVQGFLGPRRVFRAGVGGHGLCSWGSAFGSTQRYAPGRPLLASWGPSPSEGQRLVARGGGFSTAAQGSRVRSGAMPWQKGVSGGALAMLPFTRFVICGISYC
jgi:hypothetical protein